MKFKKLVLFIILLLILLIISVYIFQNNIDNNLKNQDNNTENDNTVQNNTSTNNITSEKVSEYNNPCIPKGFKKIETETASWEIENGVPKGWNTGLIIEDEIGNQFVWVPVNFANEYNNLTYTNFNTKTMYSLPDTTEKENLQIIKYGGFYVARYEAGITEEMNKKNTNYIEGIPLSKKGTIPWNCISTEQAIINSQKMYSNKDVSSDLITSRQWVYINSWFSACGYDIKDPKQYGNYSNTSFTFSGLYSEDNGKNYIYGENKRKSQFNIIIATGISDRNVNNNIYDFYGNLSECTIEGIAYGGYYDNSSISDPYTNSWANSKTGFRVVLYQL